MAYLSYEDYKDLGGQLPEATFNGLVAKATIKIDYVTSHRIDKDDVPEEVKILTFDLVNYLSQTSGITGITSYSNGIESFGYQNADEIDKKIAQIIQEALSGHPELLYRGRCLC